MDNYKILKKYYNLICKIIYIIFLNQIFLTYFHMDIYMVIYHIQLQTLPSLPSSLEGVAGAKYAVYSAENPSCPAKVDLGIILDNSGTVDDEYETVKSAAKAIMRNFNVSMDNTRVGLVEFDEGAYIHLHLTESISNDHVETLFDQRYNPIGSGTWISGGLDLMRTSVFLRQNSASLCRAVLPWEIFPALHHPYLSDRSVTLPMLCPFPYLYQS